MIDKTFILAGKAIFTIETPADGKDHKPHYTYKVTQSKVSEKYPKVKYFVGLLVNPDNEHGYVYQGMLIAETGEFVRGKKALPADSYPLRLFARTMKALWEGRDVAIKAAGFDVHHAGKCCCCGRQLTTVESINRGYGPTCAHAHGWPYDASRDVASPAAANTAATAEEIERQEDVREAYKAAMADHNSDSVARVYQLSLLN